MNRFILVVFFSLFFLVTPFKRSLSQDINRFSIHFTIRSYHLDRSKEYREWNWGVGIGYKVFRNVIFESGWYKNSNNNNSFYFGGTIEYPEDNYAGGGLSMGLITGYEDKGLKFLPHDFFPYTTPGLFLGKNPRLRAAFIPYAGGIIASQLKVGLN